MALAEEIKTSTKSPQKSNSQKVEKREKAPTKVIIRRLPPTIDKETFLNQVSPIPHYDYFYLVNGEAALGEHSFSRAYINFVNPSDVFDFKEKFDNYVFLDNKGNEYAAVVEFAAFQKIPKKRNKNRSDPKSGSIETDPIYLEFVENLNKPVEQEDKPEYSYQFQNENKDSKDAITTPLLEFVRNRRVEKLRIREERREERKRKELERKKLRDEERKKRFEENSPTKVFSPKSRSDEKELSDNEVKDEKQEKSFEKPTTYRNKERKFEDRKRDPKVKPTPRKEYPEKREFKSRREYFKESKFDTYKKEEKEFPKKVKKYSEKREERKMEAQKSELKKAEELENKKTTVKDEHETDQKISKNEKEIEEKNEKTQQKKEKELINQDILEEKGKEIADKTEKSNESQNTKETSVKETKESRKERIRNKDRPTIAIYRPGMLSKRKINEGEDKEK